MRLPTEVFLAKYGNAELFQQKHLGELWYCSDEVVSHGWGVEKISVKSRQSICLAPIMKVKDLISCGAALSAVVVIDKNDEYTWER